MLTQLASVQAFLSKLGTDPKSQGGPFSPKPLFWERPAFVLWCACAEPDAQGTQAELNPFRAGRKRERGWQPSRVL